MFGRSCVSEALLSNITVASTLFTSHLVCLIAQMFKPSDVTGPCVIVEKFERMSYYIQVVLVLCLPGYYIDHIVIVIAIVATIYVD